ncbi:hypothetical protein BC940DRAFT_293966 [Gongronella butleri]|nr:hypothetical protein BC940DRAFT_293966 [Gongronella butleri]
MSQTSELGDDTSMRSVDSKPSTLVTTSEQQQQQQQQRRHRASSSVSIRSGVCQVCNSYLDSDKDLHIRSLYESIEIHKQLVEQSQNEREEATDLYEGAQQLLKEQQTSIEQLQNDNMKLNDELHTKRQEYKRMESNFYTHMCTIRATDDDLSTIQRKITNLFGQVANFSMGLRNQVDTDAGTSFIMERWPAMADWLRAHWVDDQGLLSAAQITVFTEKLIADTLIRRVFDEPVHLGASINHAFAQIDHWMRMRNKADWSLRLRQQLTSLVAKQPLDDAEAIRATQDAIVDDILAEIAHMYTKLNDTTRTKLTNQVQKASELSLAMHGQEASIRPLYVEEGVAAFDPELFKANNKGKEDGTIVMVIHPPFVADDPSVPSSDDHSDGFVVLGKVVCMQEN